MKEESGNSEFAVEFRGVKAGYRGLPVIDGLNIAIKEGEMIGILGPNGAGKTTFLRCITGICRASSGSISIFGDDTGSISAPERARLVAVVPQELETPMAFTVQEIAGIGRTSLMGRFCAFTEKDRRVIERAMVYTDVIDLRNRLFNELSGGEKQRAIVAMALAQEPRIILLDEATSHLDMNHRLEVMQIVERLNREEKVTVIMVSHDLNLAAEFCPRLVLMDYGKIAADGAPGEVLTENLLSRIYHCGVNVQKDPAGGQVTVVPARRLVAPCSGAGMRVHVIAGGGAGEELMRRLHLCGFIVTCGVLNSGDSDADVAAALGIEHALEKPFSAISPEAFEKAAKLVDTAEAVIVCGVPFGPGNLVNLDLAEKALETGKQVLLMSGIEARDFTPGKQASAMFQDLIDDGAVTWSAITDLLAELSRQMTAGG